VRLYPILRDGFFGAHLTEASGVRSGAAGVERKCSLSPAGVLPSWKEARSSREPIREKFELEDFAKQVSMVLLFDRHNRLLIYLRDGKPDIPFPNHWDFFGGHLEDGETPERAMVREVKEELGVDLKQWNFFRRYACTEGDAYPNLKYLYWAKIDKIPAELNLAEGERLTSIAPEQRQNFKFANILGQILEDFVESGLWPQPVDNF